MAGIDTSNWLARRSAGLVFEASFAPLDPEIDPLLILYDNEAPEYISGNARTREYTEDRVPYSRHFFNGYPKEMVKKIRIGGASNYNDGGVFGTLALATKRTYKYSSFEGHIFKSYDTVSSYLFNNGSLPGLISDSTIWTGGENKLHATATLYQNVYIGESQDTPPKPIYQNIIVSHSFDYSTAGMTTELVSSEYSNERIGTTYLPFVGNGSDWYGYTYEEQQFFVDFGGEVEYTEIEGTTTIDDFYVRRFRPRLSDQDGLGASEYIAEIDFSTTEIGEDEFIGGGIFGVFPIFTFKGEPNWVMTYSFANITISCKFVFQAPNTCTDCWYDGATVELKIKYKQASLTRVLVTSGSLSGYNTRVGTFSDHSEVTKNITLPGKGATPTTWQDVGDVFNIPHEDGKIISIDDFEVVSITLPGDTPPA